METMTVQADTLECAAKQIQALVEQSREEHLRVYVEHVVWASRWATVEVDKAFDVEWSMFPAYVNGETGDTWTNELHMGVWYVTTWTDDEKVRRLRLVVERSQQMNIERDVGVA